MKEKIKVLLAEDELTLAMIIKDTLGRLHSHYCSQR